MSIGVLLVGLGRIAVGYDEGSTAEQRIYTHARAFGHHPAFELLGGVDPREQQRLSFQREYGRPAWATLSEALSPAPDLAVIAVPTPLHGACLRDVLDQARPRAVLCEKPLSYDLVEAGSMVDACRARGVRLFVNYMRRSDPGAIEIGRRIRSGAIAPPIKGVAWYSKGLMHNGSHLFNLLSHWLGDIRDVSTIDGGRCWSDGDPEPDFRVAFEAGNVVFLAAREENYSHYTIELVAGNGRLRYESGGERIEWQPAVADSQLDGYTILSPAAESIASGMARYQWHVADAIASAMAGREADVCEGVEALRTLEALHTVVGASSMAARSEVL